MTKALTYRSTQPQDLPPILADIRDIDREEVWNAMHQTPEEALYSGMTSSLVCYTFLWDETPVAMFGVADYPHESDTGIVWMLGTNSIREWGRQLLRQQRRIIKHLLTLRATLFNYVSANNAVSIKWLSGLEFQFREAAPYGIEQQPFQLFWRHA